MANSGCCESAGVPAVAITIYVVARQWYCSQGGERLAGPPGLCVSLGAPIAEDGCYALVVGHRNYGDAVVYESNTAYECFCPLGPWREVGRLCNIRGFRLLLDAASQATLDRLPVHGFVDLLSPHPHYRFMFALQPSPDVVYLRVAAGRMPAGFSAIYRLYGVSRADLWWSAGAFDYLGIMSYDEADAVCV